MSFGLFLVYVFLTFSRPIELLAPELGDLRPMLVLWLLAFVTALVRTLQRREWAAHPTFAKLLLAFTLTVAVSQVAAGWAGGAIGALSSFSTSALLYVLVVMNVTTIDRLKAACGAMVAAMVVAALLSTAAYHTGFHAKELVLMQASGKHDTEDPGDVPAPDESELLVPADDHSGWYLWRARGMGFLNDPNDFAQVMVMTLPMLWALWRRRRWAYNLAWVALPTVLLVYTTLLTQSRGAILGIASLLFFGVRKRLGATRTTVLMAVLAVAGVAVSSGSGRAYSSGEQSAADRIEAWSLGLGMLRSRPVFGLGYGNFVEHNYLTAHNSFVLCFSELGLVGFFLWIGMLVLSYKGLSRVIERIGPDHPEHKVAELLRSSLVGFLTCAWFLSRAYEPPLFFLLGLCSAAWYCGAQHDGVNRPGSRGWLAMRDLPWARTSAIAVVLALVAVWMFVRLHFSS